jgi:hypothetical protein
MRYLRGGDGQAAGFMLMRKEPDGGARPWPILIARKGNNFFGFEKENSGDALRHGQSRRRS